MEVMEHCNNYKSVQGVLAWLLGATGTGEREAIEAEPSFPRLQHANRIMFLPATMEVTQYLRTPAGQNTLCCVAPIWSQKWKLWFMPGRIRQGLESVFGVRELPTILPRSRIAMLKMISTHDEDHRGAKHNLARS